MGEIEGGFVGGRRHTFISLGSPKGHNLGPDLKQGEIFDQFHTARKITPIRKKGYRHE